MKKSNLQKLTFLNKINSKYDFYTKINNKSIQIPLSKNLIKKLIKIKNEPLFVANFRLKSYNFWLQLREPKWSFLTYNKIDYKNLIYYSIPKEKKYVTKKILQVFEQLDIPLNKYQTSSNIAIDAVFDSISIKTTFQEKLAKIGIIFCSISDGIKNYPQLIKKFLGSVVPIEDNFFSALNSAVFTDGSFCYIPQHTKCPMELSTYFRINNQEAGQFERTLIIVEKNSSVSYLEGCTAPKFSNNQLHAAVVELVAFDNADIKYSTVQNWFKGNSKGVGGVYNFVTKRGLCIGQQSKISWTQVEVGSAITWKYPSCILLGNNSYGEFYSMTLTNFFQQADTGTKMIHLGKETKSKILSKSIALGFSRNIYRGLIKISKNALNSKSYSQCDSFLIGENILVITYPYFDIKSLTSHIEHEAKISKINEEQLFYLNQRGIETELAIKLLLNGFCKDIYLHLPLEFALEANKLITLNLENKIG